ncbi:PucR family transcriptional regulator [Microbacterium sp. ARD32]|uniref:PucR family transcriptional regulator n=1 Tax=Microbacterium sp. ARD32 TaxID=2962577 RepID=UPI00288152FD|nr:PucR family transcriptional regulator [Microbacterium sp. ARD32]MDT0158421.1 PucR family transcriptional regulator [Microbacterium sp. ARD32]
MEPISPPTLRTLLERGDLRLHLIPPEASLPAGALDRPVRWVHSSDLADPTPFLAEELVLLTTGTQLEEADAAGATAYVARLVQRGVLALGFGSGVHRAGAPAELVDACADAGLVLFEVPYDTPFLAIARAHAQAIAAEAYARRTWALEAQRALAIAALRPHALESTLAELSRRLGCWVGMFDATGAAAHQHPSPLGPGAEADAVADAVAELLSRGGAASRTIEDGESAFTLFTLGRTGQLRGVIAIAAATLDPETRAVITSVIAMAGLALEQNEQLSRGRRRLHAQLLSSLMQDDPALARRVLGSLPVAPFVIAVTDGARIGALLEWRDRRRADAGAAAFVAESDDDCVVCIPASQARQLAPLARQLGIRFGLSDAADYTGFAQAASQARTALRRAPAGAATTRYADTVSGGMLDALAGEETRLLARTRLAPLRRHDAETNGELERTVRVWLEHDTHSERSATALGIHRHTLRTRIAQAAMLLEADLSSFPARAELWAALHAAGPAS